jgi:hypothetical protein
VEVVAWEEEVITEDVAIGAEEEVGAVDVEEVADEAAERRGDLCLKAVFCAVHQSREEKAKVKDTQRRDATPVDRLNAYSSRRTKATRMNSCVRSNGRRVPLGRSDKWLW